MAWVSAVGLMVMSGVMAAPSAARAQPPPDRTERSGYASDDKDELTRRLMRDATGQGDGDVMERTMRLMDEAHTRLTVRFDPGAETQALQDEILTALDAAIAQASAARRRQSSSSKRPVDSDKRTLPKPQPRKPDSQTPSDETGELTTTTSDNPGEPGGLTRSGLSIPLGESRRGWGHLPRRDRDELIQGVEAEFLEEYRALIERYYRALAEEADD